MSHSAAPSARGASSRPGHANALGEVSPSEAASALEAIATLTWALPLAFCAAYSIAWFFSLKNLLLISGHLFALGSASLLIEAASRLSDRPSLRAAARLTQALALGSAICLIYAFYPTIRMFMDSDELFFQSLDAAVPAKRLALTMTLAYAFGAAALAGFARLLSKTAALFNQTLGGLVWIVVASFIAAGLASALHAAFAVKVELREMRHLLAFGLLGVSALNYARLYPAISRVAQCLQGQAAREAQAIGDLGGDVGGHAASSRSGDAKGRT